MSNRKLSVHQEHELLQKLEEAGLGPNETQTVIESKDNKLAKKVVDYIKSRRIFKFKNKKIAREILGNDIIFPDEITEVRGLSYSEEQLKQLDQMFPTEDMLRWCRYNNYAVMPAPPSADVPFDNTITEA